MNTSAKILDQYAESGLLERGASNEEFEYLERASQTLSESLTLSNVIPYFLASISSNTKDNAEMDNVEKIITSEWRFFNSKGTNDKPIMVLKAVVLTAVEDAIETNESMAAILWLAVKNLRSFMKFPSKRDQEIIDNLIEKFRYIYKKLSIENYKICFDSVDLEFPSLSITKAWKNIDIEATVPSEKVSEIFEKYLENLDKTTRSSIRKYTLELGAEMNKQIESIENRNQLIWWKESLYSNDLDCSYRDLKQISMLLAMALDMTSFVPLYCPVQIEYLLRETLRSIIGEGKLIELTKLTELVKLEKELISKIIGSRNFEVEKKESLIAYLLSDELSQDITQYSNIPPNTSISLFDLVVWFFNDFQIKKIIVSNGK